MCFKSPKPPSSSDSGADPELARERQQAEIDNAAIKADNKQTRMEQTLAMLTGRMGRKSLFTGGQGGAGYPGAPARRFTGVVVPPAPPAPPAGDPSLAGGRRLLGRGGGFGGFGGVGRGLREPLL